MRDREHVLRRRRSREELKRWYRTRLYIAGTVALVLLAGVVCLLAVRAEAPEGEAVPHFVPAAQEEAGHAPKVKAAEPVQPTKTPEPTPDPAPHYPMTDEERSLVERVVFAESGNQPLEGQMAVAQCILNTAVIRDMRPDEVVLEPNQYADPVSPDRVTDSVREAVRRVFDEGETATDEPIRFFYAPKYSRGSWHESALEYVLTIGGHRFFKEGE